MTEPDAPKRALRVLVVDDERNILTTLCMCLEALGCAVTAVASEQAALRVLPRHPFDLAFVDLRLNEHNGLDLLPQLLKENPDAAVVLISAYGTLDTVVQAVERGATHYLPKPFTPAQIRHVVDQATERRDRQRRGLEPEEKRK